jgi:hypothetical protein
MDGDRVCRGVLRVRTEEGKGGRGATASSGSLFERGGRGRGRWGSGDMANACARCRPNRGGGEKLTGGPRQQCRAAVPLTSEACRAAGEGERSGALTGGTGPSAGVDGGEAAAYAGHAWAGPGRKRVGRA